MVLRGTYKCASIELIAVKNLNCFNNHTNRDLSKENPQLTNSRDLSKTLKIAMNLISIQESVIKVLSEQFNKKINFVKENSRS